MTLGRRTGSTALTAPGRGTRSTRSTLLHPPSPARFTWVTCFPTRTPTSSLATSGCAGARCSTRWAATTTDCPPGADFAPQLRRTVRAPDRRGREAIRGAVAPPGPFRGLVADVPNHRTQLSGRRPAGLPALARARGGLSVRGTDAVGRDVPHGRGPGGT